MKTYFRILGYLRRYPSRVALGLVTTALFAATSGLSLTMIIPVSGVLFAGGDFSRLESLLPGAGAGQDGPEAAVRPGAVVPESVNNLRARVRASLLEWFASGSPQDTLERICVVLFALFVVKTVIAYVRSFLDVWLEQAVIRDLRNDLFEQLTRFSLTWYHGRRAGEIISRMVHDVSLVRMAVNAFFTVLLRDSFLTLVYLGIVVWVSWKLALFACLVMPPVMFFVSQVGRRLRRLASRSQERMEDITSVIHETVSGIRIVKAFGMEPAEVARFRGRTQAYFRSLVRLQRIGAGTGPLSELITVGGALFVFWFGGKQVLAGQGMHAEWFIIFLVAMLSMMRPIKNLTTVHTTLQEGIAAGRRIFRVLDLAPTIADGPGARAISGLERDIVFERVSFAYEGGPRVLHEVALHVRRGQVVALVGPSGAGKSTLVDLLPRFYDPVEGRILIDGRDLREIRLASLRACMGIVTQETILFHDTVASNIGYGSPGAEREAIAAAARAANAHDFIVALPAGYETVVGDRGVKLSGGQRQRLAIARALLRNPAVLIFDEATSALDSESEAQVQEAIERLLANRTTFVVAHRLSTIQHADVIVVLDRGRVVQRGTHAELLAAEGMYRRLYEMQFARAEPAGRPR